MPEPHLEPYRTRSLRALDLAIANCTDRRERAILFAKRAANLARLSSLDAAKGTVAELRAINSGYEPRLSSWIMFTEGVIHHFESLDEKLAYDRFRRAYIFSSAAGDKELAGCSAAWIAHCMFVAGDYRGATENAVLAFRWSDDAHGDTRARASLVIADLLSWSGQHKLARPWYHRGRGFAIDEGDLAMQNVMLFNLAAFHVADLTLRDCMTGTDEQDSRMAMMEVDSAATLNQILGNRSLLTMVPLLRAELLTAQGKWQSAIVAFDEYIDRSASEGQARLIPKLLAQRAWCHANMGNTREALRDASEVAQRLAGCQEPDERAISHFRLAQVGRALLDEKMAAANLSAANSAMSEFRDLQSRISMTLEPAIEEITALLQKGNPA